MFKSFIKNRLSDKSVAKISRLIINAKSYINCKDLTRLAMIHQSDKGLVHSYTNIYQNHFEKLKGHQLNILEIGVGGYKNPNRGGASLRMWKKYFKKSNIFGIDLYDKSALEERRIKIFQGSQIDENFLSSVVDDMGSIDIIIDDGSHVNEHIIKSFQFLFPKLNNGGIYVVEDIQTSYWESYGGNSDNLNDQKTAVNYFKGLVNGLNYNEFMIKDYEPSHMDKNILSIHFYHNIILIYKGDNSKPSSYLINNQEPNGISN